jgi:hypothetical protein
LNTYHIGGFRYGCMPNYWDAALGVGYANLVFNIRKPLRRRRLVRELTEKTFIGSPPLRV